jgi:hypothetical protein
MNDESWLPSFPRFEGGAYTRISLTLPEAMQREQWIALWPRLQEVESAVNWMIGDWLNFGRRKYGEKYVAALEFTDWQYQRLLNAAYICAHVPPSIRRPGLDYTHHAVVAPLPEDDQVHYLDQAEQGKWTVSQLRVAVRRSQAIHKRSNAKVVGFVPSAWVAEFKRWARQQDWAAWSAERRAMLRAELLPVMDIYRSLDDPIGRCPP